ncbi:calcium-binding protein [Phytophthora cinnamomi]|uniref:calcium-binding protein n=1 Tax=Phytophthora cinnamomi TaxID=4785 RepID=UPI00355A01F0|nr:calcium-binding protein [Phytophthora cinnamomi]
MLHGAALRSLLRSRPSSLLAPRLVRPSLSFAPLIAARSSRFGAQGSFAKSLQTQTFASLPSRDDELAGSGKSKRQQIQELLEENAALKKEVEALKVEVAKKPAGLVATIQQYGMPFFFWWTSLYLVSGLSIYAALDAGLISGAAIIDVIMQIGLDKFIDPTRLDPTYGNIAIAFVANECLEVIRFPFTLATLKFAKNTFSRKKVEEAK